MTVSYSCSSTRHSISRVVCFTANIFSNILCYGTSIKRNYRLPNCLILGIWRWSSRNRLQLSSFQCRQCLKFLKIPFLFGCLSLGAVRWYFLFCLHFPVSYSTKFKTNILKTNYYLYRWMKTFFNTRGILLLYIIICSLASNLTVVGIQNK